MFRVRWVGTGLVRQMTGIERLLVDCVTALAAFDDIEQTVIAHADHEWLAALPSTTNVVLTPRRRGEIARAPKLRASAEHTDFVHSFGAPFPRDAGAFRSYTVHDWGPLNDRTLSAATRSTWTASIVRSVHAADQVHFYADTLRDEAPAWLLPLLRRRRQIIGLPVAPTVHHAHGTMPAVPRDPHMVLTVGSDFPRKRFGVLADAVTASADLRLTLAGGGTEQRTAPRITGLGRVTDDELAALYQQAAVFALVSSYEGFGLPVLEAWLAGCQIVITESIASRLPRELVADAVVVRTDAQAEAIAEALGRAFARRRSGPRNYPGAGVLIDQITAQASAKRGGAAVAQR